MSRVLLVYDRDMEVRGESRMSEVSSDKSESESEGETRGKTRKKGSSRK